jgi:mannose PTS system EIID component
MAAPVMPASALPWRVRAAILLRLLAVQGSWNYETMLGNGIAFALEPALRRLPGGVEGAAYREAMAREARYFNAHPYLASIAVGALARAELDGEPAERIERFRGALVAPLGSIGDRLVWAGWLPCCSMLALLAFGLGAPPLATVLLFLGVYNAGHIALRVWGLDAGWRDGLRVAGALARPVFRDGPQRIAAATLVLAGAAIPFAAGRCMEGMAPMASRWAVALMVVGALALGVGLVRGRGRVEGWKLSLIVLFAAIAVSVLR